MLTSNRQVLKPDREFRFTQDDFNHIVELIYQKAGISLSQQKVDMVYSRLARRVRKLNMHSFHEYIKFIKKSSGETSNFINALTTNLTHFFRENHHFEYLEQEFFPEIFGNNQRRIRAWSAGCSTGEEPYSLSMVWHELKAKLPGSDFKILATDLDTNVLENCKLGIYHQEKLNPVSQKYRKWFKQTRHCQKDHWQINPKLRNIIYFKHLNLMDGWPMKGPLDIIICRNVLIYFDKTTQQQLIDRFADLLAPGGVLILGHSEKLSTSRSSFTSVGKTIYRIDS